MRRRSISRSRAEVERGVDGVGAQRERSIAELAAEQRGVIARTQLLRLGLSEHAIDHRVRSSRLHILYRGVYLLGNPSPAEGARELGAVLAFGAGAVLSHGSAAALWRLHRSRPTDVDVTVCGRRCDSRPGIRVHTAAALDRRDVRKLGGIPVTAPARTLLDLGAVASSRELERAVAEAEARRLVRRSELLALLARAGSRRGVAALRSLVEGGSAAAITRSEAEERFLALVRAAELPDPEVNVRIGRHEVDFLWRDRALIVEVDGFRYHSSRTAFERDRARDAELGAAGFRVMRVTWRQIVEHPEALIARLATALESQRY